MGRVIAMAMALPVMLISLTSGILAVQDNNSEKTPERQKKIFIYLLSQTLRCYEDDEVVYETRVCTGRGWHTSKSMRYKNLYWVFRKDPRGSWARCTTRDYDVATPWKIELSESPTIRRGKKVRIHEFHSVPRRPSSHGCVREPIGKGRWLYYWVVEHQTPVHFKLEKAPKTKTSQILPALTGGFY